MPSMLGLLLSKVRMTLEQKLEANTINLNQPVKHKITSLYYNKSHIIVGPHFWCNGDVRHNLI